ncbi:MAG: efflux transporter outer membrane subunit [Alistipes sp.]|nr:efflux transporter outer membrane subunit [Alistipes sp.]
MRQIVTILALLLVACNPKLQQPTVIVPQKYLYGGYGDSITLEKEWWKIFRDTTLNRLINTALQSNYDLKSAVSKIEEAKANMKVVRSQFLPSFDFGRSATVSGDGNGDISQQYVLEPYVSWEIPLFGELKAATTSAKANIEYAQWQYEGVKLSLAAEVATTYFTLLQYQRNLNTAAESSRLRSQTAVLVDSLYKYGMATKLNREQAYSLLYTSNADIPLYERAIAQTKLSLNLLLGQEPEPMNYITDDNIISTKYIPIAIPVGLPSDLLYRRPDVMSSYASMISAAASAKLARVARFPLLSLTGEGGLISSDISKFFTKGSWSWSAMLSLTQPIYRFRALKNSEKVAVERYNQALMAYRQGFLTALSDVEKALVAISTYREQLAKYQELVQVNDTISKLTNQLYINGLSAYLDVIDAERTLYNSQMEYSNLIATQYINYINLCKALGGGVE